MYMKTIVQYHCDMGEEVRADHCKARGRTWYKLAEVLWEEGVVDQTEEHLGGAQTCDWCYLPSVLNYGANEAGTTSETKDA